MSSDGGGRLATPTTDDKRLPTVLTNTSGFVYYVSITGITGDAAPDTGWDDYNDYLEKNKKVPDGADDIHGSVVVRFNIDNNGNMKNFAIEKSLNETLDAEAIRLVKEGPSWHLLKGKGKKSKVTVMVRF